MIDMPGHDLPQHVQALEAAKRGEYGRARTLLSQLPDGPPWTLVRADPEIFRYRDDPQMLALEEELNLDWSTEPRFLVVTPDQERAMPALERAMGRFKDILADGRQLADWEYQDGGTPNSVHIAMTDSGPIVSADVKDGLSPGRGYSMLRILVDELLAEHVRALIAFPPSGIAVTSRLWMPSVPSVPPEAREQVQVIARYVLVDIGDGRRYPGQEYLSPDGGWTLDPSAARQWPVTTPASDLAGLARTLRDHDDPAVTGQPGCVRLDV